MARTITTIYDSMIAEKQSMPSLTELTNEGTPSYASSLLADLDSRSRVAIWRLMIWIVAVCAWTVEKLMDNHKDEVTKLSSASIAGTNAWLAQQVKLFELNNGTLTVNSDRKAVYAVSNPSNRIVAYSSVTREYGRAIVKVAKFDGSNLPTPLSVEELAQLATYVNNIQFAGTKLAVVSRQPDQFKVIGQVYYNGLLDPAQIEADIQTAVVAYLTSTPFVSRISLEKVTDAIQKVTGVNDLVVQFYGRPSSTPTYGAPLIGPTWAPYAGFAVLDNLELTLVIG